MRLVFSYLFFILIWAAAPAIAQPNIEQQARTKLNGLLMANWPSTNRIGVATYTDELAFAAGQLRIAQQAATTGQVLKWNGTKWAPGTDVNTIYTGGTGISVAGTVITNTLPDQTVSITGGGINAVTGTYPNFTVTGTEVAQNLSLTGQSLGISAGGSGVTLPVVGINPGTNISVSNAAGVYTINNTAAGLPAGVLNNTIRYDGTNWVTSAQIINNGTQTGIGGNPISGYELYVAGGGRFDGTLITRGVGLVGDDLASKVRFWNTGGTGDSYDLHSENDGTFTLSSSAQGEIFTTVGNDLVITDRLRITGSGTTATSVTGRNAASEVCNVTIGSGLTLTGGTLSTTGGGSGTVTSVAVAAPASGVTVSGSPITTSGTITLALNNDLLGVENLATNGIATRTAANTWTTRTLTAGSGISITNADGVAGNPTIAATTVFLKASASLDFPSIASRSTADLTINVASAVLGDVVAVGSPIFAQMQFTGFVSSNGVVTVRAFNASVSAADPPSLSYKVTVIQ